MGLYLYSTGSQQQLLSVMSHLGLSESYDSITGKKCRKKKKKKDHQNPDSRGPAFDATKSPTMEKIDEESLWQGGSLRQLSNSMLDMARAVASTGLFATSYDNINMVFKAAEQVVGRTGRRTVRLGYLLSH